MYVGLLNFRWGKLRSANSLAICGDDQKPVAWVRFWTNIDGETSIAIKPIKTTVVIEQTEEGDRQSSPRGQFLKNRKEP